MNIDAAVSEMEALRRAVLIKTDLEQAFFTTDSYLTFRSRVFSVLEAREHRLKAGLTEQKGAALIGPPGSGKSRMVAQAIGEYQEVVAATGGREFGCTVVSATVPGRATVKETSKEILRQLGYPTETARDDDYLVQKIMTLMQRQQVAGLHLDEVQDSGRHNTTETRATFVKRFRNLMQDKEWPVCLILSGTLEARELVNHDGTFTRRLRPIEIRPMTFSTDCAVLRAAVGKLLTNSKKSDLGLFKEDDFVHILMHAAAYRFGLAIEMTIEAIGEAHEAGERSISLDHFAGAYFIRTNCDDDMNPFMSRSWRGIDTTKALDRNLEEQKALPKRGRKKT